MDYDDEFYERDIDWKRDADEWERRTRPSEILTEPLTVTGTGVLCSMCGYIDSVHEGGCPKDEWDAIERWGRQ